MLCRLLSTFRGVSNKIPLYFGGGDVQVSAFAELDAHNFLPALHTVVQEEAPRPGSGWHPL